MVDYYYYSQCVTDGIIIIGSLTDGNGIYLPGRPGRSENWRNNVDIDNRVDDDDDDDINVMMMVMMMIIVENENQWEINVDID